MRVCILMRKNLILLLALVLIWNPAQAGQRMNLDCEKALGTNNIMVSDGTKLPNPAAGFKVLRYKANRIKDGKSYGPCLIESN